MLPIASRLLTLFCICCSGEEIRNFVNYWVSIKGIVDETLVFDSKLTRYNILYKLDKENIKFITLRRKWSEPIRLDTLRLKLIHAMEPT